MLGDLIIKLLITHIREEWPYIEQTHTGTLTDKNSFKGHF